MTSTLLKHEWLRTRSALGAFAGIVTLLVVVGGLLGATGWPLLSVLGYLLAGVGVVALLPVVQLLLAVDYWRSSYSRTGYFTHSIPVRGSAVFRAKLVWAMIVSFVGLVLTVLLGLVFWWALSRAVDISAPSASLIAEAFRTLTEAAPVWMVVVGAILLLASVLLSPVYYYFSASIGSESRLSGMGVGGPIVVIVLLYVVIQVISLLSMIVIPVGLGPTGDGSVGFVSFNLVTEMAAATGGNDEVMPLGFILPTAALVVYCLWRTARSWNRHVALT